MSRPRPTGNRPPRLNRRQIEREFGVPFPGEIVEESQWTKTALKQWPVSGAIDWLGIFGRDVPKIIDIGCGNGRYLIGSALWRPDLDHLGVDILPVVVRYATRRANQRGLANIRFAVIGGRELLERHVSPHSVSEIHCYHPQPYHEPADFGKRLITPQFLALAHRALIPGGRFFVQTDSPGYWRYIRAIAPQFFEFEERSACWSDAPRGRTRREIIALRHGLPVYRASGQPRAELTCANLDELARSLPPPAFSTERAVAQYDELERE